VKVGLVTQINIGEKPVQQTRFVKNLRHRVTSARANLGNGNPHMRQTYQIASVEMRLDFFNDGCRVQIYR
jgi:hypothetical protein